MLGVARGRLDGRILLARADARALPFPAGAFEHVVSTSALHFWRDPLAGLSELARVLAPGGRLVLTDWSRDFLGSAVRELYLRLLDPAHVRTYRERELREMLEEAGLRVLSVERYRIRPTWGMMTAVAEPARDRAAGLSPA
jgi:ubiquinone/menaquinone biosynthesis C-methylase UbiE